LGPPLRTRNIESHVARWDYRGIAFILEAGDAGAVPGVSKIIIYRSDAGE
jgi:hypothetical protein